jgi:hypothetical protein
MLLRAAPGRAPLGAIFAGLAVLAALGVRLVGVDGAGFTLCLFKAVTGIPCMTCGTTRALARLGRLDLPGAFAMNPLAALAGLAVLPWALADLWLTRRGHALALDLTRGQQAVLRVAVVAAVLANWAYLIAAGR